MLVPEEEAVPLNAALPSFLFSGASEMPLILYCQIRLEALLPSSMPFVKAVQCAKELARSEAKAKLLVGGRDREGERERERESASERQGRKAERAGCIVWSRNRSTSTQQPDSVALAPTARQRERQAEAPPQRRRCIKSGARVVVGAVGMSYAPAWRPA